MSWCLLNYKEFVQRTPTDIHSRQSKARQFKSNLKFHFEKYVNIIINLSFLFILNIKTCRYTKIVFLVLVNPVCCYTWYITEYMKLGEKKVLKSIQHKVYLFSQSWMNNTFSQTKFFFSLLSFLFIVVVWLKRVKKEEEYQYDLKLICISKERTFILNSFFYLFHKISYFCSDNKI